MALSPSAPASPLRRQLLRYVSSGLVAALHRPAPIISLPIAPRGVDAAASQRLQTASRAAPSPKGRPGAPRQGSGGHVHAAAPALATIARMATPMRRPTLATIARMATPMRRPTPPDPPAQGSGGKTNAVTTATTAHMVIRGPARRWKSSCRVAGGDGECASARACSARSPCGRQRRKNSCCVTGSDGECAYARARPALSPDRRRRRAWWSHPCNCFLILELYYI
jgi:hypothetical protein